MRKVKSTLLVDEDLWNEFKRLVVAKHGSMRMVSAEVEEAISGFTTTRLLNQLARMVGLKVEKYPSSDEVKRLRKRVEASSADVLRAMRDEREKAVSGLE